MNGEIVRGDRIRKLRARIQEAEREARDHGEPRMESLPGPSDFLGIGHDLAHRLWTWLTPLHAVLLAAWVGGLYLSGPFRRVYLMLSALVALYLSTTSRQRGANELGPYSIFNPGFQRMLGTLTLEQIEGEIRRRPLAPQNDVVAAEEREDGRDDVEEEDLEAEEERQIEQAIAASLRYQ
jgi:hypothetical protein